MKFWTYSEAKKKVELDLDLQEEIFISDEEMIGYFNEGVKDASSEILKISEDYFLTKYYIPTITGQTNYEMPLNMYAQKIRGIQYVNGAIVYPIKRIREKDKFDYISYVNQFGSSDDYMYWIENPAPNEQHIVLLPAARETSVVPPASPLFTPFVLYFIRESKRIPLLGEYVEQYEQILPAAVDTANSRMNLANTYVTGDQVQFSSTVALPLGIASGATYWVIALGAGLYQLATSKLNAKNGVNISLTSQGSGIISISIAANQSMIDNTLIDVPMFIDFVLQFVKVRCLEKDGNSNLQFATLALERLRKQMVDSLTEAVPDNDTTIQPDFSIYDDMYWRGYN